MSNTVYIVGPQRMVEPPPDRWVRAWVADPFSKWGGTSPRQRNYRKFLWFEWAIVTSSALKYDVITYTLCGSFKFHYFRQKYTTIKTYRWTTWNSNRLLQGGPRLTASLGIIIRFILTEWNRSTFASLKFPLSFMLAGNIVAPWR